jgi:hypothetical protein
MDERVREANVSQVTVLFASPTRVPGNPSPVLIILALAKGFVVPAAR